MTRIKPPEESVRARRRSGERKRLEALLRECEERFLNFFENAPLACQALDEEGRLLDVNRAWREMLGYSSEEVIGRLFEDLMAPESVPGFREGFARLKARGEISGAQRNLVRKDGSLLTVEIFGRVILDEQGRFFKTHCIFTDVTGRKRAEETLKESEATLRSLLQAAPIGIGLVTNRVIEWTNDHFCQMVGYEPEELIGQSARLVYESDEEFERVARVKHPQVLERGAGSIETRFRRKDGEIIDVLLSSAALAPGDLSAGLIFTALDITERKRDQEALLQSEEQYRTLFETMAQGVVYQDREGRVTSANPASERILGLSLEQMRGRTSSDQDWKAIREDGSPFPGEEHPAMVALRTGEEVHGVAMGVFNPERNDYRWLRVHAAPQFREGESEPYQVFTTFGDMTQLKQAEDALRESETRYRLLTEVSPVAILAHRKGRAIFANPAAAALCGADRPEDLLDREVIEFIHPEDRALVKARWEKILDLGSSETGTFRWVRLDGGVIEVEAVGRKVSQLGESVILGVLQDVTERKRAEEALRESETRYRTLFEAANEAIFLMKDGLFIDCNSRTLEIFGCARDQIIGQTPAGFSPERQPDGQSSRDKALESTKAALAGRPQFFEWRHNTFDGQEFDAEISLNKITISGQEYLQALVRDVTERKRAEEALKESEERFRLTFDQSPMGAAVVALDGRYERVNRRFEKFTGYSAQELAGMNYLDLTHPEDRETSEQKFQLLGRGEVSGYQVDKRFLRKDGQVVWGRLSAQVINDAAGQPVYCLSQVEDITASLLAEEALRAERDKAQMYLDTAESIFLALNEAGEIDLVNRKACQVLGYEQGELLGENWVEKCLPERLRTRMGSTFRGIMAGDVELFEFHDNEVLTKSGEERVIRWHNTLIRDGKGRIIGTFSSGEDVTERRKAERERDRLFELSVDMLCVAGFDGYFKQVNPAWTRALGWASEELMGKPWLDFVHPEDRAATVEAGQRLAAGGAIHAFENRYLGKDGVYRWISWNSFPLMEEKLIFAVARDVTERKKAEEEQQKLVAVIENTDDFIGLASLDGQVIYLNRAGRRLAGLSGPEEVRATTMYDYVSDEQRRILTEEALPEVMARGLWRGEGTLRHFQTGGLIGVEATFFMVRDADSGQPVCLAVVLRDIRERKRAEEALRESEARFRDMAELLPTGVVEYDLGLWLTYANRTCLEMFGYSRSEVVAGINIAERIAPEDRERGVRNIKMLITGQNIGPQEYSVLRKDGSTLDVLLNSSLVIRDGEVIGLRSTLQNITERKQAEEALRESEERFRLTFDHSPIAAALVGTDDRYLRVNAEFQRFTGYSQEELTKLRYTDITHLDDLELSVRQVSRLAEGEVSDYQINKRFIRKDGRVVWGRLLSGIIRDAEGRPVLYLPQIEDITERKRAEEALRESEERFRLTFDQSPLGTALVDFDGRYLRVNAQLARFTGYSQEELTSMTVVDTTPPEDIQDTLDRIGRLGRGELSNYQVEKSFLRKDGRIVYSRLSAQVIKDTAGRPLYLLSQIEDITETRRIEAERIRLEEQLNQAQKMEAIGTLAGGIAHDFNNILGAMIGYAEMASMETAQGTGLRRSLEQILKGGQRARDLVKQILAFSRQQEQERGPIKLGLLVKETIRFLRASLPTTVEIRQQIAADSGVVVADPTQVHQLIMNLAANAAHAMRARGGMLTIELYNVDLNDGAARSVDPDLEAGSYVRLSVGDTGTGIEPGVLSRIFDPFFTTKKPGEGTGLGLSVVHGIVKSLGGGITVSSQLGQGTTFQVYLPRSEEERLPETERPELLPLGQGRVLLVDDEAVLVDMGRQMLEYLGYEVVALTSSLEALKVFKAEPEAFDVVVTDQTMPQMTGFSLAKKILALRPDMPVVLCTGYSELVTPEQAKKVGIKEYIMKPVVMKELGLAILSARGQAQPE